MPDSPEERKRALTRVRRIKGQVAALERALEQGDPCYGILQQLAATRGAIHGFMGWILEVHLRETLGSPDLDDEARATHVEDINKLIRSYMK